MAKRLESTTTSVDKLNHEIHQRKLAEKQQTNLLQQIEATNTELKNFAYIVSHDLKAPLRGIQTIADWIQEDYADKLDEDGKEQLGLLSQRVERMKLLIDGVLQYSRVGHNQEDIKPVNLDQVIPDIIDSLAVPDHITIIIDKPLPTVHYESTRLSQVFSNLLCNAVKYMDKPEGEIRINFSEDNDHWTFSITDNGPGIEVQYHDKIFGIFQTLQPRDDYESTGVGLAVVKKTIELAGGRIWVTSEVGNGSTFSFTVPKPNDIAVEPIEPKSAKTTIAKSA
jgi:light-regulated signal transduction histidine kinase (bacteriophytochrome)